jgi:hypothetical protein
MPTSEGYDASTRIVEVVLVVLVGLNWVLRHIARPDRRDRNSLLDSMCIRD